MHHVIPSRNAHSAMTPFLQMMQISGEQDGESLAINEPVIFRFERPRERLIFYPAFRRNVAQELGQALASLSQAEETLPQAAAAVLGGARHFMFSTPHMVVRGDIGFDGRFNLYAVVTEDNPFRGALGQLGLQMSLLQELMAGAVKKQVGTLTIQHMSVTLPENIVMEMLKAGFEQPVQDPYNQGMKPRKIDGPLDMKMLTTEGEKAAGYKSKWARHVALPLLACLQSESPEEAEGKVKNIKADDWRRAMSDWLDAVIQAEAFKQETDGGEA